MKRKFMTIAGIFNTLLFIGALVGSLSLIYSGGKVVYDTLRLGLTNLNGITALIYVFATIITGILLLIGIVALIFSIIMLVNSKNLIKKAKLPDEQFAKRKGGIIAYIIFCLLIIGGCAWFLNSEIIMPAQNMIFIYVLGGAIAVLFLSSILIIIDMGKKINPATVQVVKTVEVNPAQTTITTEIKSTDEPKK